MLRQVIEKKFTIQILSGLTLAFCFRVIAQLLQKFGNFNFLPSFNDWQSGSIPYLWLFISQVIIISIAIYTIFKIHKNTYKYSIKKSKVLLFIGWLYFIFMLIRFVLSITILQSHPWYGATIPAAFHMVLAAYLIVLGWYEYNQITGRNNQS